MLVKKLVNMSEDQKKWIEREAERQGVSSSEIVRIAINNMMKSDKDCLKKRTQDRDNLIDQINYFSEQYL